VRAFGVHDRHTHGAASKVRHLTSYRQAGASYYGPGLYGNGVACGGTLTPDTLGVANRTLPCGTMVKIRYHGRHITVPVIDRGPYVAGRDYDLTEATRNRLGFPGVGTILANH
jgi:rare lipoprotein A (peptidoglycan hydrolase)